jgi:cytoskeletal protein RodZ
MATRKVMDQTANPKGETDKLVSPRKRVPTRLQGSNTKTRYGDLSTLFSVIVSLLVVVVSFLTFCAIFCAICVQAAIYFFQLKQISKSTDAATRAANAAEASVKQVNSTARRDQRAWIAVVDIQGIPEVGTIFSVNLVAQNSGKTFAKNLTMRAVVELISEKGKEPDFSLEDTAAARKDSSASLLAPNADYVMDIEPRKQTPPHEITQSDFDGIRSGNLRIFVHGRMTYDDIFGCAHWTSFCARLKPDLKYASCGTHNDADQNRCP